MRVHVARKTEPQASASIEGHGTSDTDGNVWNWEQNVGLAVHALHALASHRPQAGRAHPAETRLVLAGGYDVRLAENRKYFAELQALVDRLGLQDRVPPSHILLPVHEVPAPNFHSWGRNKGQPLRGGRPST